MARGCGFTIEAGMFRFRRGTAEEHQVYRISKIADRQLLTLDLLLVAQSLEHVWSGRERYDWRGQRLGVVSREGLRHMKRLAGRPQDLVDIERLEGHEPTK